jgi:dihydroflavonol-4-reductase
MILVTGGTGLLGAHLLYKLVTQGKDVKAIYRDSSKFEKVKNVFSFYTNSSEEVFNKITWIRADINDVPALDIAFKNVIKVYHCAADLSFNKKNYNTSRKVNVEGTANIVNLCLSHQVFKLCHVSSIATLGESLQKPINEETKWNTENKSINIYAMTKYDAELEVWRGVQEGLNVVIVNPGVILGPGFWNTGTGAIFNKVSKGFNFFTSGTVGVVDVNDVVTSMLLLMNATITNEQFIIVSENITYKALLENITNALGINKKNKKLSKWQLLLYLQFDIFFSFILSRKRSVFRSNINSAFKFLHYDTSKIKKTIVINFLPISESIQNTAEIFKKDS